MYRGPDDDAPFYIATSRQIDNYSIQWHKATSSRDYGLHLRFHAPNFTAHIHLTLEELLGKLERSRVPDLIQLYAQSCVPADADQKRPQSFPFVCFYTDEPKVNKRIYGHPSLETKRISINTLAHSFSIESDEGLIELYTLIFDVLKEMGTSKSIIVKQKD